MKRTLSLVIMAAALLLTQCKKPSIEFPTPSVTTTVSMTITAGPGSKTDITTEEGRITWSEGDKIYVGNGSEYVGYLTIQSGVGNPTGTFTGDVTVATGTHTFHFYYLGSAKDYSKELTTGESASTSVEVDFSSQDIHADGSGNLTNASKHHVGYGKAEPVNVVAGQPITGLQVSMKSKVAIAYFRFRRVADGSDYTGALTLRGDNIYNKMTVNFNKNDFDFRGEEGDISLTNTTTHLKYAMLVPTSSTAEEILNFGGGVTGSTTLANGIEANKFYRIDGRDPIVVEVKGSFSVDKHGNTVEFSPGNLQYLGNSDGTGTWRFAEHQWDYMGAGPSVASNRGNVDLSSLGYSKYNTGSGYPGGSETDTDKEAARDLFGWGCTGFQDTRANQCQTNYQPYSTSSTSVGDSHPAYNINCYGYGPDYYIASKYGLSVEHNSDWGCLVIDGYPAETWRTLSTAEWEYLLHTSSGIGRPDANRCAKAKVSDVKGLLIFPDGYALPDGYTAEGGTGMAIVNKSDAAWPDDNISTETWTSMENTGVVFLPAAGYRNGTSLEGSNSSGYYWSSTCHETENGKAYYLSFGAGNIMPQIVQKRYYGRAVRLVRE